MSNVVKRFYPSESIPGAMRRHPEGDWVDHDDYAALEAENARLTAQLAAVQGGMEAPDITTGRGYPAYSVEAVQRITAAMTAEVERLRQDNIALARNLRGNVATTGATYEHLVRELDALRTKLESIRAVKMESYRS